MLSGLNRLALEVKYLDRARAFYETRLDLPVADSSATHCEFAVGDSTLVLRAPDDGSRGGLHTHYAFSTPADEYDDWHDRLGTAFDLTEHRFGSSRSLYLDDPDDHCVEIGQSESSGSGLTGIFEIVLEVESLERAEAFYVALGMDVTDRGDERARVRLDAGPVDVELWEPQLGIADARGGVHVDVGFDVADPEAVAKRVTERACSVDRFDGGVRVRDPDGHYLTFEN